MEDPVVLEQIAKILNNTQPSLLDEAGTLRRTEPVDTRGRT